MAYINASGQVDNQLGLLDRIQITKVTLTAAQLTSMFSTPVQILPAPAAGMVYVVNSITVQTKPTTTAFASGGVITCVYHGTSVTPHASSIPAATLISTTGTTNQLPFLGAVIQPPANTGIDITNATANFSTGTGTAIVKISYRVQVVD